MGNVKPIAPIACGFGRAIQCCYLDGPSGDLPLPQIVAEIILFIMSTKF